MSTLISISASIYIYKIFINCKFYYFIRFALANARKYMYNNTCKYECTAEGSAFLI